MIIVGIYGAYDWDALAPNGETFMHDAGCTIFIDGKHICSITEERLSRHKHDGNYPHRSIDYCLSVAGITKNDVDVVYSVASHHFIGLDQIDDGTAERMIQRSFPKATIKFVGHHLAHSASTVFTSPFNEGSFLTLDGGGSALNNPCLMKVDFIENNSIGYFNKEKRIFRFYNMPEDGYNCFGNYYSGMSAAIMAAKTGKEYTNWLHLLGAIGKVMGLSAYGKLRDDKDGYAIVDHAMPYATFGNYESESPEDAARYLQHTFENAMVDFLKALRKYQLDENVCFAGGCFLNILANTAVKEAGIFDNIHIPPFVDDSGIAFGAAIWACFEYGEDILVPNDLAFLGKEYSDDEILSALNMFGLSYSKYNPETIAQKIEDNKIIGWFQGRSEAGPRALGSRSILMSPKRAENKDIINERVKHREMWRPFAGIIREEDVAEYFEEGFVTPHMLYSQTSKTDKIPAITHVDGTCRIQTVKSGRIYDLLGKLDVPVVLNTSFNDNGEPIVESPYHTIKAFLKMDMDTLVIGNYIVDK